MGGAFSSSQYKYREWMTNLLPDLQTKPLNSLAIPGSHDSFSFYLNKKDDVAPNLEGDFFRDLLLKTKLSKDIIWNWAVTQSLNFQQQLESGIRYFDLRIVYREDSKSFYFAHGLYGVEANEAFPLFDSFLKDHSREVIILHFQHLYCFTAESHKAFQDLICTTFNNKLCPPATDARSVTLNSLWQKNHQVIVVYNADIEHDYKGLLWPRSMIQTPWPNVTSPELLIEKLNNNCGENRSETTFHVSQGVLTPDAVLVLEHLGSTLKEQCAKKAAKSVVNWIRSHSAGDRPINICIMDYAEKQKYIPSVIKLNLTKK